MKPELNSVYCAHCLNEIVKLDRVACFAFKVRDGEIVYLHNSCMLQIVLKWIDIPDPLMLAPHPVRQVAGEHVCCGYPWDHRIHRQEPDHNL